MNPALTFAPLFVKKKGKKKRGMAYDHSSAKSSFEVGT